MVVLKLLTVASGKFEVLFCFSLGERVLAFKSMMVEPTHENLTACWKYDFINIFLILMRNKNKIF